jgi:hypothetical protein
MNQPVCQPQNRAAAAPPGAANEAVKFRLVPKVKYSLLALRAFAYFSKVLAGFSETPPKLLILVSCRSHPIGKKHMSEMNSIRMVAHSENTLMWSQKNLPARRTANRGCADNSGAVGDSTLEVGFMESDPRSTLLRMIQSEVLTLCRDHSIGPAGRVRAYMLLEGTQAAEGVEFFFSLSASVIFGLRPKSSGRLAWQRAFPFRQSNTTVNPECNGGRLLNSS